MYSIIFFPTKTDIIHYKRIFTTILIFKVISMLVALSHGAPSERDGKHGWGVAAPHAVAAPVAYAGHAHVAAPVAHVGHVAHVVSPPVVRAQVHEHIVPGPAVHQTYQEVVGHNTVQVGVQPVQVGHTYTQEQSVHQPPAYTYVAEPAKTSESTVPVAPPVIPAAPLPYAAIPPAPTNQGPAPADTVTITKIQAPVRTHTIVTPQVTRIEPELQINKYEVEVPVAVPVPVEREVIVEKHVAKPYTVEVPQPYAVPKPYVVNPVQHVVETPVIDQHHTVVHQPAVHAVAAPVAYAGHAHIAAPVAHAGVAHVAAPNAHIAISGLPHKW